MEESYKLFKSADDLSDSVLLNMISRRASKASGFWESQFDLSNVREKNRKYYLGSYLDEEVFDEDDRRYQDNRIFANVRTILPFVTARITQPEVLPSSNKQAAKTFAASFEMSLQGQMEKQYGKEKVRLMVQDNLAGERVGIGKWRYNRATDDLILERVDPRTVIIGYHSKQYEEPDFLQHELKKTVADLCLMFPEKKDKLYMALGIDKGTESQFERELDVKETWMYLPDENMMPYLYVCWSYQSILLGKEGDPNWKKDGSNVLDHQMMPFFFINFLNNGDHLIDETSFVEQSLWLQRIVDKRGQTIAQNAEYGGIGVPVFSSEAMSTEDAAKVKFSPEQRIVLNTQVQGNFDVWKAGDLQNFIIEDKFDTRNSVDNIWGAYNIFRGEQSDNKTLGQDVLLRDQASGRQQELIDAIDAGMERCYQILAQLMYRYFDEEHYYPYIGEDGSFAVAMVKQKDVDTGVTIRVKAGTSLPVDREQQRAATVKLFEMKGIDPYTAYKMFGFDDPETMTSRLVTWMSDPAKYLQDVKGEETSEEAEVDLRVVISGGEPQERDDIDGIYINHLNNFLLTNEYEQLPKNTQTRVSDFIRAVMAKGQAKLDKLQNQLPSAEDVVNFNQQTAVQEQPTPSEGQTAPPPVSPPI